MWIRNLGVSTAEFFPAVTQPSSAVDGRTARGKSYALSLRWRETIEEAFSWIKTVGGLRKTRHKGLAKLSGQALLIFAAYNLMWPKAELQHASGAGKTGER